MTGFEPPTALPTEPQPLSQLSYMRVALRCRAGDVAGHLGCFINLKDSVNAITLVCIGTSVPDIFASRISAVQVTIQ